MRNCVLILLIFCLLSFRLDAQNERNVIVDSSDSLTTDKPESSTLVDSVLHFAEGFIGCKYGYGSCGPGSFDCSGFVQYVFGKYGVELPHGSGSQKGVCEEIKLRKARPGDLLFFSGRKISKSNIGHVAIVKAVNGEKVTMIHATVQAGVIVEVMQESEYFSKRFITAGRLTALKKQ